MRDGVPPHFVERLVAALDQAPLDKETTEDWMNWLLDVVGQHPQDIGVFMRETALESVFGRAYTNSTKPKATARRTIEALQHLIAMWCGGRTLVEIEEWLLRYVRKHEGEVAKSASRSSTAQRACRFAIRIAPDLGFLWGVLGQVVFTELPLAKVHQFPSRDPAADGARRRS